MIAAIPLNIIGPFLTEAVVFDTNELDAAPRIVATQEGRVMLSRGETAYVRGDLKSGGVGFADSNPKYQAMKDVVAAVDKAKQDIIDGKVTVTTR